MKIYFQILIIFAFSFIGDSISNVFNLPIPGSIIGMIFLFLALQFKIIKTEHIDVVGDFLINNMTILFLPAGVGIMAKWGLISKYWIQISFIVILALIINIFLLGRIVQFIKNKYEGDYVPKNDQGGEIND
ncbi:murein hydrolase regulator LrgA [Floricoccus penangensis]|uniref:Murein hydrolase regulator LrgA n=1 Tax=Floricoccus penangensis TaxID=1859475 RepID=A0A9Q5JFZ7_9LACT|nr:CidA/LrgA family protein [Floricoccus penangensis]OFI46350.1 murein hydrolase regulator LrgA [Floricoccus penangensis]